MDNEKILSNEELLDITGGSNFVSKSPAYDDGLVHALYSVDPVIVIKPSNPKKPNPGLHLMYGVFPKNELE